MLLTVPIAGRLGGMGVCLGYLYSVFSILAYVEPSLEMESSSMCLPDVHKLT